MMNHNLQGIAIVFFAKGSVIIIVSLLTSGRVQRFPTQTSLLDIDDEELSLETDAQLAGRLKEQRESYGNSISVFGYSLNTHSSKGLEI